MLTLRGDSQAVTSIAFSPDGDGLLATTCWGAVYCWRLRPPALAWGAFVGGCKNQAAFFVPEGRAALFGFQLHSVDAATGAGNGHTWAGGRKRPLRLAPAPWPAASFCTSHVGTKAVYCHAYPGGHKLWHAALPGDVYQRRRLEYPLITSLAFSPAGRHVAAGCLTGEAHVLRASDGKAVARLGPDGRGEVKALALSPDGSRLALCSGPRLWLYRVGPPPALVEGASLGRTHFTAVAWHPSGAILATANNDGKVDYWGALAGERLASFDWGVGKLTALAFDLAGDRAACGAKSGRIVVWDVDR